MKDKFSLQNILIWRPSLRIHTIQTLRSDRPLIFIKVNFFLTEGAHRAGQGEGSLVWSLVKCPCEEDCDCTGGPGGGAMDECPGVRSCLLSVLLL